MERRWYAAETKTNHHPIYNTTETLMQDSQRHEIEVLKRRVAQLNEELAAAYDAISELRELAQS